MKSLQIALLFLLLVAAGTVAAQAQSKSPDQHRTGIATRQTVEVFIPGNASGYFGRSVDQLVPLVSALSVTGPGTITVTYLDGTVDFGGNEPAGPNGVFWQCRCSFQLPLNEAHGIAVRKAYNMAALIGAFVPQSRVLREGFNPIDGTKNATKVGIMPGNLFFIGESKTFDVKEAGTLFLGINDPGVADNSGGFNVEVTGP